MGVEGCTHVDTMSAPIVNFDVRYRRAGQHFLRASTFSPRLFLPFLLSPCVFLRPPFASFSLFSAGFPISGEV